MSEAIAKHADHGAEHPHLGHIVPLWLLGAVFATLLVLTAVTVAAAHVDLGNLNLYVALGIAGIKATLVILYFMHLRYDKPFIAMFFIGCLGFVILFISLSLTDTRAFAPSVLPGQAPGMQKAHTPMVDVKP